MDTRLLQGDCLTWIPKLPKASVDFIFCDPPFGSIKEGRLKSIDKVIPPDAMWNAFRHVLKPSGTVAWFGTQPFISQVICSNLKWFRYDLIWRKTQSGHLNCNNQPMREHQTIAVFSERSPVYNAQLEPGKPYLVKRTSFSDVYRKQKKNQTVNIGDRQPSSVLTHKQATSKNHHPFEKPLSLCEWLVRTFTNEGQIVLDPTMGGGSSGVACRILGRKFIGIELDPKWFDVSQRRIYSTPMFQPVRLVKVAGD